MHTHAHWAYTFIYFGIGRSQLAEFPFTPVGPTDAGGVSTCPLPQALMGAVHRRHAFAMASKIGVTPIAVLEKSRVAVFNCPEV